MMLVQHALQHAFERATIVSTGRKLAPKADGPAFGSLAYALKGFVGTQRLRPISRTQVQMAEAEGFAVTPEVLKNAAHAILAKAQAAADNRAKYAGMIEWVMDSVLNVEVDDTGGEYTSLTLDRREFLGGKLQVAINALLGGDDGGKILASILAGRSGDAELGVGDRTIALAMAAELPGLLYVATEAPVEPAPIKGTAKRVRKTAAA